MSSKPGWIQNCEAWNELYTRCTKVKNNVHSHTQHTAQGSAVFNRMYHNREKHYT